MCVFVIHVSKAFSFYILHTYLVGICSINYLLTGKHCEISNENSRFYKNLFTFIDQIPCT